MNQIPVKKTALRIRPSSYGALATILAGTFWGVSGTVAQVLFVDFEFPVLALLTIRMLLAGVVLVAILGLGNRPKFSKSFLSFAIVGIALSQFSYLEAIQQSNAVTATLLQFLFLPMVAVYEGFKRLIIWSSRWSAVIALAAVGTVLLVINVSSASFGISITPLGLFFGLLAAVLVTYETIAGGHLSHKYGPWPITSWGFLIGGLVSLPFGIVGSLGFSIPNGFLAIEEVIGLASFVGFGTLVAYGFYFVGLGHLPATEVGVLSSVEPIAAGAATFALLGISLMLTQYLGGACIVVAVALLGFRSSREKAKSVV